jgi:hypothetical protein
MASIKVPRDPKPTTIEKFLGLNEDTASETQLLLGESPRMPNFRLTEKYKPKKREGYIQLFASLGAHNIRGMWYGKLAGTYYFLFAYNGNVYKHVAGVNTLLGAIADAKTFFFSFSSKVYILNGVDYKSFDGTTFETVAGYIPLIATATPPGGGGVADEQINLLTGKKRQKFSGNATATFYQCAETTLTSIDQVYVDGVLKTLTTDYTVDLVLGRVIPVVPANFTSGVNNIQTYWTKGTGSRAEITANFFAMLFGGRNDTRVFFYGDGTNRYYYSGLADGVPSAEYCPALNYREVGSAEFAVTDIVRQYDRQLICTNGRETHYSYYDPITVNGVTVPDFPTFPLNDAIGNIAFGQAQLIENNPFTIQNGVHEWVATNVRDERNANYKSKRVEPSLATVDLTQAISVDWEAKREYWLSVGKNVWIYNYRLDVWYRFSLAHEVTCFIVADNVLYFGTPNGQIMKFDSTKQSDNGTIISSAWEMNFYDFKAEYLQKFINEMWVSLKPEARSSVLIQFQTDKDPITTIGTARYNLATFAHANFGAWSFLTSYNPQPFYFPAKAKKFVFFKLILTNAALNEDLTILSINLPARYGGKAR